MGSHILVAQAAAEQDSKSGDWWFLKVDLSGAFGHTLSPQLDSA